jgi:hypothetical protein
MDTPSPCCCCLTSRKSLVTAQTNYTSQSSCEVMSAAADSFPGPEPTDGDMVDRPGLADTKLSLVGESVR